MRHCMLDLETWGTKPGSALRSIGAVMFELDGRVGRKYYANIDLISQNGLTTDQWTIDWWTRQDSEAQALLNHAQRSLETAVSEFHKGFVEEGAVYLWGNGANFDPVLWEAACTSIGKAVPWKFYNVRCCRTWCAAHNFNPKSVPFDGVKHYAIDDCLHQIKYVQRASGNLPRIKTPDDIDQALNEMQQLPGGNTFGMV